MMDSRVQNPKEIISPDRYWQYAWKGNYSNFIILQALDVNIMHNIS